MLIFTHDKGKLADHFRRDPILFAYHCGDLDDFFFERCQWLTSYHKSMKIDEVILIYDGALFPTVLAFGLSERFPVLLTSALDLLPDKFYCHYFEEYRTILCQQYIEEKPVESFKMKLNQDLFKPSQKQSLDIRRLTASDQCDVERLYEQAYPDNYFDSRMLTTGKYFGCYVDKVLVSAGGVHVYDPKRKIVALGNIATAVSYRGNGFASAVTSMLVEELLKEDCMIVLNVRVDNASAIQCYERLGFQKTHTYHESLFTRR